MNHKKSRMLKITGILLIIWGFALSWRGLWLLDIVLGPPICCPNCAPARARDAALLQSVGLEFWPYVLALFLLGGAIALLAGFLGILYWKNPQRANRCLMGGIAAAGVYLFIFWLILDHLFAFQFLDRVLATDILSVGALALYALYIIGALRLNRRSPHA